MDLRPRQRKSFTGFTKAEIEKMEQILENSRKEYFDDEFCKKLARIFNRSKGRAGKPVLKWTEVQSWLHDGQKKCLSEDTSSDASDKLPHLPGSYTLDKTNQNPHMPEGEKIPDLSDFEFEARSSKDGAWYDVDKFLDHRFLGSGESAVRVRFIGFGSEEDEWVHVPKAVRLRSVALEHSECHKVKVGDPVLCFQESKDQARYYDARVLEIQRKLHDIRGCRCLFFIRYDHDNSEERVRLRRLCCQPSLLGLPENS